MTRTRILLVDDHFLQTDVLMNVLKKHFDVAGVARDGQEMIEKTISERPDVVIADVTMPVLSGTEAARILQKEAPSSKLLFLTMHDELPLVEEAFLAGAYGYVHKSCSVSDLIKAIRCVARGSRYVTPGIGEHLLPTTEQGRTRRHGQTVLTQRRRQILQMIAQGMTMKEIAGSLGISTRTAETHKYLIMRTLGVSTTAALIRYAIRTKAVQ